VEQGVRVVREVFAVNDGFGDCNPQLLGAAESQAVDGPKSCFARIRVTSGYDDGKATNPVKSVMAGLGPAIHVFLPKANGRSVAS
jgi:hypothetical protein